MIELGKYCLLTADRKTDNGFYLIDDNRDEVLLPNKYAPEYLNVGGEVEVFVYLDSEERLIATTLSPKIKLYEYAFLEVLDVNDHGAYLDWGLEKDLFCPFREQKNEMQKGESYVVYLYLDIQSDRLVASSKIDKFIFIDEVDLEPNQEVDLLIYSESDLGYNAIVNDTFMGLIFRNEVFKPIQVGDKIKGFVKQIREDEKIDLMLQKQGYESVEPNSQIILDKLKKANGFLPFTDKSAPEDIKNEFEMSKKIFKKAIGGLYREKVIRIEKDGIYLS